MEHKYKEGEKVLILTSAKGDKIAPSFEPEMNGFLGRIVTLRKAGASAYWGIEEDNRQFFWAERWFVPLPADPLKRVIAEEVGRLREE